MKQHSTICIMMLLLLFTGVTIAQDATRYLDPITDEVKITRDERYGVNATILFLSVLGEAVPVELFMDVYEPADDSIKQRPLVLIFATGNFLPQNLNGNVYGTKSDSSSVETAMRLAKLGYVAACVDYRTGWNPLAPTQPERAFGLIQAAYRGVQDARTAVRYFKKTVAEEENKFGVDTTKITYFGYGTGGYVSLNAAYLSEYSEIINSANPAGKFLLPDPTTGIPTTPMIIEAINGDVEGKKVGIAPPGLDPIPAGDTLNYPNHVAYSSDVQFCVNAGGALGDITWLDQGEVPYTGFQNPEDAAAPYDSKIVIVPTTGDGIVEAQGSKLVAEQSNVLGNQQILLDQNFDDPYTQAAKAASEKAGHPYFEGLYPFNIELDALGNENGDPWQWWDTEFWSTVVADTASGATWDQVARSQDAFASADYARAYIDTIFGYFLPRAYAVLSLDDPANNILTSTQDILSTQEVGLMTSPNPAHDLVNFQTADKYPIQSIEIMDLNGRLLKNQYHLNHTFYQMSRDGLASGLYLARLKFKEGIVVQKIMFD